MRAGILLLSLTGCHVGLAGLVVGAGRSSGAYEAGTIARELGPDAVRTLACLDVGLAMTERPEGTLLELDVGNRCVHGEPFALNEMIIRATGPEGGDRPVAVVDPRGEIVPRHVGALDRGHERIRLSGTGVVTDICFELTGVVPDAPHTRAAPLCLFRAPEGWRARPFS